MAEKKAKKSAQKKSAKKQPESSKGTVSKADEPLISTKKKVGIAVYFTFLATLAGVMGAQLLFNNNNIDNASPTTPADTYTTQNTDNTINDANNFVVDYPKIDDNKQYNVATPFEEQMNMQNEAINNESTLDQEKVCTDGSCDTKTTNDCESCPDNTVCENGECVTPPLA